MSNRRTRLECVAIAVAALGSVIAAPDARGAGDVVEVHVRGRGNLSLPNVGIYRKKGEDAVLLGTTDSRGVCRVEGVPTDSPWEVAAWAGPLPLPSLLADRLAIAKGPRMEISLDAGARITIRIEDAATGAAIAGARWCIDEWPEAAKRWVPSGTSAVFAVGTQGSLSQRLKVDLPVAAQGSREFEGREFEDRLKTDWVSLGTRGASDVEAVVPICRVVTLACRSVTREGKSSPVDRATWRFVGEAEEGGFMAVLEPTDSFTLTIPWYRGARVDVRTRLDEQRGSARVALPSMLPTTPMSVRTVTPETPIPAPAESPPGEAYGVGGAAEEKDGAGIDVTVRSRGGAIAAGVVVRIESSTKEEFGPGVSAPVYDGESETDAGGVARFRGLPPDLYRVRLADPRFVPAVVDVVARTRKHVEVATIQEPTGFELEVTVVDPAGLAVPYAAVVVTGALGGRGDAGVSPLRCDPFTDKDGRRSFHGVEAGACLVRARYGPFRGEATVELVAGATRSVRVVVRQGEDAR